MYWIWTKRRPSRSSVDSARKAGAPPTSAHSKLASSRASPPGPGSRRRASSSSLRAERRRGAPISAYPGRRATETFAERSGATHGPRMHPSRSPKEGGRTSAPAASQPSGSLRRRPSTRTSAPVSGPEAKRSAAAASARTRRPSRAGGRPRVPETAFPILRLPGMSRVPCRPLIATTNFRRNMLDGPRMRKRSGKGGSGNPFRTQEGSVGGRGRNSGQTQD